MSNVAVPLEKPVESAHAEGGHGGHHGPAHLHHHFTDAPQQREANALGMWAFLITEVMTFSVLFFAYTLYRNQFDITAAQTGYYSPFAAGSHMLNGYLGFGNTLVLLCSSLTMASAVHCAVIKDKKWLVTWLCVTWVLGLTFLCVKGVEWTADYHEGIMPRANWNPADTLAEHGFYASLPDGVFGGAYPANARDIDGPGTLAQYRTMHGLTDQTEKFQGVVNPSALELFFCIYFCMTGLHAIHMIIGLGLVGTFIWHAKNGWFTDGGNDQPVEILGLYWHFVDIVWVFLYPLLYLIYRY